MAAASVGYRSTNLDHQHHQNQNQNQYQHQRNQEGIDQGLSRFQDQDQDVNHVHPCPPGNSSGHGPLRLGAYHIPRPSECLMGWDEICNFIATGDLDDLKRHPRCESEYASWAAPIRKEWGSLESYIRSYRLGWHDEKSIDQDSSREVDSIGKRDGEIDVGSTTASKDHPLPLCFNTEMDERMAKCIPNDWPYAIPGDCAHYVVWCRVPIIDSSLFSAAPSSKDSSIPFPTGTSRSNLYDCVVQDGVRGLTGQSPKSEKRVIGLGTVSSLLKPSNPISIPKDPESSSDSPSSKPLDLDLDEDAEEKAVELAALAHRHAGRFIDEYVKENWNEKDWQTAWFCNPPHLRTVPGLSHFHVIARKKQRPD